MALQLFNEDLFAPFLAPIHRGTGAPARLHQRGIPIDIKETQTSFMIDADLPGLTKDSIKLQVDGRLLSLAVDNKHEKQVDETKQGVQLHCVERSSFYSKRSLRLPESADLSKINARYSDGVLKVAIPKHEAPIERSRAVAVE